MGVDETNIDGNIQERSASSAALLKLAETAPDHNFDCLMKKIEKLCLCGNGTEKKPAIRMEMCEITGLY